MSSGRIDFFSLTRTVNAPYPGPSGPRWPDEPVGSDSALTGDALTYLAEVHEHDHFAVLLASPLGLLLWRTAAVHVVDGTWFARRLEEAGVSECPGGLDDWFTQAATRRLILNAAADGRLSPDKPPSDADAALETMDDYLVGLRAARRTRELLVGSTIVRRVTIGEFLQSANTGHRYLSIRSDLPSHHWVSRLDPAKPLYGNAEINALHLLEAMARLKEVDVLRSRQVPQTVIDAWEGQMIAGRYRPVITQLRSVGLDSIAARNVCAAALGGLLDPAVVPQARRVLYAEEELPWLRFARLIEAYRGAGIRSDDLRKRAAVEHLCHEAGITPPREAVESAASAPLIGRNANWNPVQQSRLGRRNGAENKDAGRAEDGGSLIRLLELFEQSWVDVLDWFRRSFERQLAAWRSYTLVEPDLPSGPVLYEDLATLRPESDGNDARLIEILRWRRRALSECVVNFVEGRPVDPPEGLARRVEAGMDALGLSEETINQTVDVLFRDRPFANDKTFGEFVQPAVIARSLSYFLMPA
jgi:hypothetical protein